ncbi:MAG: VOC family protein [Anaerolineaceae bacterium]|nr:VOC family protein [Anaerolineaceae bacterium]
MISHLQMITIYVRNLAQSVEFYSKKLGFEQVAEYKDEENHLVWLMPSASRQAEYATQIALYAPADPNDPRIGASSGMVFTADDIEATYHELKQRGVHFTMELVRHAYGDGDGDQEARFVDPDGNQFLLHT